MSHTGRSVSTWNRSSVRSFAYHNKCMRGPCVTSRGLLSPVIGSLGPPECGAAGPRRSKAARAVHYFPAGRLAFERTRAKMSSHELRGCRSGRCRARVHITWASLSRTQNTPRSTSTDRGRPPVGPVLYLWSQLMHLRLHLIHLPTPLCLHLNSLDRTLAQNPDTYTQHYRSRYRSERDHLTIFKLIMITVVRKHRVTRSIY